MVVLYRVYSRKSIGLIFTLFLCSAFANGVKDIQRLTSKSNSILDFSLFITREKFPGCTVILTQGVSTDYLMVESILSNLVASDISAYNLKMKTDLQPFANKDFKRYLPFCSVIISVIGDSIDSTFSDKFFNLLLSPKAPLTKRDEDHYIFITENEKSAEEVLRTKVAFNIRYKIAIHKSPSSDEKSVIKAMTMCLYCISKRHQRGKIVELNPSSNEKEDLFPDFTLDFKGYMIQVSAPTRYLAMYQMKKIEENGKTIYIHSRGFHTIVFHAVQKKLNLTYELSPCSAYGNVPAGSASGTLLNNGTWAGCLADTLYSKVDMSLSVSPDDKRINFVDFTIPIEYTWLTFTTRQPKPAHTWKSIFNAFKPSLWLYIMVATIVTGGFFIFFENHTYLDKSKIPLTLGDISMAFVGALLTQSSATPSTQTSKVVYIFWLFYALIVGTAYNSKLTASITSPKAEFVPKTFKELVNSDFSWGASRAFREGLGDEIFRRSSNPIMRKIYKGMDKDKDDIECTGRAANSRYACFAWEVMQQFNFKTIFSDRMGNHPFSIAEDTAFFVSMNFITRKREIFRSHFNNVITNAYNSGLIKQWIKMDWQGVKEERLRKDKAEKKSSFTWASDGGPQAFTIQNFKGAFSVLFIGCVFALFAFLGEKLKSKLFPIQKNVSNNELVRFPLQNLFHVRHILVTKRKARVEKFQIVKENLESIV